MRDGDLCTRTDACTKGACVGGAVVVCEAKDQCHVAGACDPGSGLCTEPRVEDGEPCDDTSRCTNDDVCTSGVCAGVAVVCQATGVCRETGVCDEATGLCTSPFKPDDTPCDEGDLCTVNDHCESGECVRGSVECTALDVCHEVGTCLPATGQSTNPVVAGPQACDDGDHCTVVDACGAGGACVGSGRPDDSTGDWNLVLPPPATISGASVRADGGGLVIFELLAGEAVTLGPTALGEHVAVNADFDRALTAAARFDSAGRLVSVERLVEGPSGLGFVGLSSGFALTGLDRGELDLGVDGVVLADDDRCMFLARYDREGSFVWYALFDGSCDARSEVVGIDDSVSVGIVPGALFEGVRLDDGELLDLEVSTPQVVSFDESGGALVRAIPAALSLHAGTATNSSFAAVGETISFVTGFESSLSVGGLTLAQPDSASGHDVVIGSVDAAGNVVAIALSNHGNSVTCRPGPSRTLCSGWLIPGASIYGEAGELYTQGVTGARVVLSVSRGGELQWLTEVGGADAHAFAVEHQGRVRMTGSVTSGLTFNGAPYGPAITPSTTVSFLAELDDVGVPRWLAVTARQAEAQIGVFATSPALADDHAAILYGHAESEATVGTGQTLMTVDGGNVVSLVNSSGGLACGED